MDDHVDDSGAIQEYERRQRKYGWIEKDKLTQLLFSFFFFAPVPPYPVFLGFVATLRVVVEVGGKKRLLCLMPLREQKLGKKRREKIVLQIIYGIFLHQANLPDRDEEKSHMIFFYNSLFST